MSSVIVDLALKLAKIPDRSDFEVNFMRIRNLAEDCLRYDKQILSGCTRKNNTRKHHYTRNFTVV